MNVQLILYPQYSNGVPSGVAISPASTGEMISNPSDFTAAGTSPSSITGAVTQTAQLAVNSLYSTMATNTWYGYFNAAGGGVAGTTAGLVLYASNSGALQKIQGLTVGALYDVTLTWNTSLTPQNVKFKVFNANTPVPPSGVAVPVNGTATLQFTAPSANNTVIAIDYTNAAAIILKSVSIQAAAVQPIVAIQNVENGAVICDLYEDEDIPLSLSVDNFKNAAEQVQSYSKAFNLPATKRNNKIFDQMFEITRTDDGINFSPYKRTKAVLKQNGFLLFEGYLRMLDITDKEGEISYNVNLYSEVVALADVLEDRTFADLDFRELKHDYTFSNIRNSWQGILALTNPLSVGTFAGTAGASTTGVLRYPFVDWNHQFTVDLSGNPVLPNLESAFRPFISLKYIIDMIFDAPLTPFSFTSAFFNSAEFGNLYMDFNWGSGNAPMVFNSSGQVFRNTSFALGTTFATINFDVSSPSTLPSEFGYSAGVFTAQTDNQSYTISYDMTFELPGAATPPEQLTIQFLVNGVVTDLVVSPFITTTTTFNYSGNFTTTLLSGETILCQAKSTGTNLILAGLTNYVTAITSSAQTTNETLLDTLRGELGQWEFLKGIMTMFNLVTMPDPDNPNNLLIEPYSDVFITNTAGTNLASRSIEHDWTEKIDISEMKLEPLTNLNLNTLFKFAEDDDDFCFNEYKRQVGGHLYGSKKYTAAGLTILDGTKEIVADPFAATVIKPLEPQYFDFIVPAVYARDDNKTCSGFDNLPRIMYNNGVHNLTSCTYFVPKQNGATGATGAEDEYLRFSHLSAIPTIASSTADYLFGSQQLAGGIIPVTFNLFNRFWLPYYSELYNPDTRTMTIKVNLNAGDINTFKFNDKVFIKNRTFRVNKIDYKPNDLATVEFILL